MPRLDLTTAKRIKVASGEVSRLKGVGFEWVKPVSDLRTQVIAALFGASEQGAMYDPSDLSTLFQDASGTTPVTADSQPVGRMLDVSGNGNHITQANAARKPLYRTNGALHWLEFDGIEDGLQTPSALSLAGSGRMSMTVGLRRTGSANAVVAELGPNSFANSGTFAIFSPLGTNFYVFRSRGSTAAASLTIADTVYTAPVNHVAVMQAVTAASNVTARVNQTETTNTDAQGGGGYSSTQALNIGTRDGGTSLPYGGRIFSFVLRGGALSAEQLALVEQYTASQSGVTL